MKTLAIIIGGLIIAAVVLVALLLNKEKTEFAHFEIKGIAMTPNYKEGQIYRADEKVYKTQSPQRGEVVVFKSVKDPSTVFAKRIIGLPEESLETKGGKVYVNNNILEEPYLEKNVYSGPESFLSENNMVTIPNNTYFVMGDNRPHSSDSREWGFLPRENIVAKLLGCFAKCTDSK